MEFKPFKIGKYLLLERLAMGGMAEVYRAKASGAGGFEKQLAIKRILPNYSESEEFRRMFEYEARLCSQLSHANIVQIYDFVKSNETYLLAMEYIDGKNLRQFINKLKKMGIQMPVEISAYIINETCKGLDYAHKKKDDVSGRPLNIIHRDMSPQNVMLSYEGGIKIVDFGIAKAKDRADETRSGVIKGKFGYMSPEQANGKDVDHRTDIFSTTIILWELLTSKRLFATENDMATLKLIQECVIPPPSKLNPRVTSELEKITLKGLTKDQSLRFQSAGQLQRSLQEFLNKNYSSFSQKDLADLMQRAFAEEIVQEKKRFEQVYRQSIPFSQGAKVDDDEEEVEEEREENVEIEYEESATKSDIQERTAVTGDSERPEPKSKISKPPPKRNPPPPESKTFKPVPLELSFSSEIEKGSAIPEQKKSSAPIAEPDERTVAESISVGNSLSILGDEEITGNKDAPASRSTIAQDSLPSNIGGSEITEHKTNQITFSKIEDAPELSQENSLEKTRAEDPGSITEQRTDAASARRRPEISISQIPVPPRAAPRTATNSGLKLEGNTAGNKLPKTGRESSVSFIRELKPEQSTNAVPQPNSLSNEDFLSSGDATPTVGMEKRTSAPANERRYSAKQEKDYRYDVEDSRRPQKKSRGFRTLFYGVMLIGGFTGTIYFYHSVLDGNFSKFVNSTIGRLAGSGEDRTPTQQTEPESENVRESNPAEKPAVQSATRIAGDDCILSVESDPAGAKIMVGNTEKGITPTRFSVPCKTTFLLRLEKEGYDSPDEKILTKENETKRYYTLHRIEMGTLVLTLNRRALVEIPEARFSAELDPNQPVEIPLPVKKRGTYRVHFVNKNFGIDAYKDVQITLEQRTIESIRLDEGKLIGPLKKR